MYSPPGGVLKKALNITLSRRFTKDSLNTPCNALDISSFPFFTKSTLYTHLFELGFSSICELLGKRVLIKLPKVTGDSSLRSE